MVVEQEEQVFALAINLRNASALEIRPEPRWRRQKCVVDACRLNLSDTPIHDDCTQPKANYFDFGQLGHGPGDMVASLLPVK